MAKVHLEAGRFGLAACGSIHVDTERNPALVTCKSCRNTQAFQVAEYPDVVATDEPPDDDLPVTHDDGKTDD